MVEYADFEFYIKNFHGSTIPENDFSSAMLRAGIFIRYITFGRIDETNIPEEAKLAACAVADLMYKDDLSRDKAGREKKSENNDGYSVSYVTSVEGKGNSVESKTYQAAGQYLAHTGLMYRGIDR